MNQFEQLDQLIEEHKRHDPDIPGVGGRDQQARFLCPANLIVEALHSQAETTGREWQEVIILYQ